VDEGDGEIAQLRAVVATLTAAVNALNARTGPHRADVTFNHVAERYKRRISKACAYSLVAFLAHFGTRYVRSVSKADYLHWRDDVRAETVTRYGRKPSVGTLNQELIQVLAMLRWAVLNEIIDDNPFEGVPLLKGQRPRETEIDPEEDRQAFAGAPLLVRAFHAACDETGARNGCEVRLIERAHIDRIRGLILFPRKNTKGQVMTREVPVSKYLLGLLERMPVVIDSPYVFANPITKLPYSRAYLCVLSRPYLDKLTPAPGDGRVVTHDRRHARVSRFARGGLNPMTSMKLVGHRSPAMHWRYLHVSDADREDARRILDGERQR
jgi:integrase